MEYDKNICPVVNVDGVIERGKQYDLDITLPEDNRNVIYGIVRDCYKDPICDAVVKLIEVECKLGKDIRKPVSHTFTDENGEFVFGPLCANRLYEVEIPEDATLLDEQKQLSEQPESVQRSVQAVFEDNGLDTRRIDDMTGKDIQQALQSVYGDDRGVAMALKEAGLKGYTYEGRNDGRCYVVFDDAAIQIIDRYNQSVQAAYNASTGILHLFDTADQSSFIHEAGHLWLSELEIMAARGDAPSQIMEDLQTIRQWGAYAPEQLDDYKETEREAEFRQYAADIEAAAVGAVLALAAQVVALALVFLLAVVAGGDDHGVAVQVKADVLFLKAGQFRLQQVVVAFVLNVAPELAHVAKAGEQALFHVVQIVPQTIFLTGERDHAKHNVLLFSAHEKIFSWRRCVCAGAAPLCRGLRAPGSCPRSSSLLTIITIPLLFAFCLSFL